MHVDPALDSDTHRPATDNGGTETSCSKMLNRAGEDLGREGRTDHFNGAGLDVAEGVQGGAEQRCTTGTTTKVRYLFTETPP